MEEKLNRLTFVNAALFGLILATGYYILYYKILDPQSQLDRMNFEITNARGSIEKLDKKIKEDQKINQEIEMIKKKADNMYAQFPKIFSVEQASSVISQEARNLDLSIQSLTVEGNWKLQEVVAVININISVSGSFQKIMIFLSELSRKNKIYSVVSLSIRERKNKNLELSAKIQTYRRFTEDEIRAKSEIGNG